MSLHIQVLWTELSGYLNSCLKALVQRYDVELRVCRITRQGSQRAYDDTQFAWLPQLQTLPNASSEHAEKLIQALDADRPDVIVMGSWNQPVYRRVVRWAKQCGIHVIGAADNQWLGTWRQWLGVLAAPIYLHRYMDAIWVPGARSRQLARRFWFSDNHILLNVYSCDVDAFAAVAQQRLAQGNALAGPKRLLFVGRLAPEKGISTLLAAFKLFRQTTPEWELWCVGNGPLVESLAGVDGVRHFSFVQPDQLPQLFAQVSAFVLPSIFEPWGVVVHEAASAGLPIICSEAVGSGTELVEVGINGYVVPTDDVVGLAEAFQKLDKADDLQQMGVSSLQRARSITPAIWADTLIEYCASVFLGDSVVQLRTTERV